MDATCHMSHEWSHSTTWLEIITCEPLAAQATAWPSRCSLATQYQNALSHVPPFADSILLVIRARILTRAS